MRIGSKDLTPARNDVYVIAEIGGNHNGDPDTAHRLVAEAATTGADAVKFQTYRAETLVHPDMEAVPIARRHFKTQFERFRSLEFADEVYGRLIDQCDDLGIDFLTTPYDVELLEKFEPIMPAIKIASGDATYYGLIRAAVSTGKPVIVSTGFCNDDEVQAVARLIPSEQCALLHCVSIYPLPDEQVNLRAMERMAAQFPESVIGYSDHTIGPEACIAATALGARILEKHFTLDTTQVPGDHVLSLEPEPFGQMVAAVRRVAAMRGDGVKPSLGENLLRRKFRRGVYAAHDLAPGHVIREADLLLIRPLSAIGAERADELVGKRVLLEIAAGRALEMDDFEPVDV